MQSSQRVLIEELKAELKHYRAVHDQLRSAASSSAGASHLQQTAHLEDLACTYRNKAQSEQELLRQTQQELERAKQQLDHHRRQHRRHKQGTGALDEPPPVAGGAAKSVKVLKERLSHQKEKYNEAVSRNKVILGQIEEYSTRGTGAQQLHAKLHRQLADAAAEAEQLQEHIGILQEAQHLAITLAEQLRLQDDAEQLSFDAANKQLAVVVEQLRQQEDAQATEVTFMEQIGIQQLQESAVAEVLKQLVQMLQQESHICCTSCHAEEPGGQASEPCSRVVQQVKQLQEGSLLQFKRCSVANMQLLKGKEQLQQPSTAGD